MINKTGNASKGFPVERFTAYHSCPVQHISDCCPHTTNKAKTDLIRTIAHAINYTHPNAGSNKPYPTLIVLVHLEQKEHQTDLDETPPAPLRSKIICPLTPHARFYPYSLHLVYPSHSSPPLPQFEIIHLPTPATQLRRWLGTLQTFPTQIEENKKER